MDFSHYYLMYGWKPRLPIDIKFGLMSPRTEDHSRNEFVARLNVWFQKSYEIAQTVQGFINLGKTMSIFNCPSIQFLQIDAES